jgi:hypothetical protein
VRPAAHRSATEYSATGNAIRENPGLAPGLRWVMLLQLTTSFFLNRSFPQPLVSSTARRTSRHSPLFLAIASLLNRKLV